MRISSKLTAIAGCGLLYALLAAASASGDDAALPTSGAPGTWQKRQYSFAYLGFTSTYSCDGLADKLKVLLLASGARKDVQARPGVCVSEYGRPDRFARAELTFYTLMPATGDATGTAAGGWRPVSLAARSPRDLATGDCELVEQFRANVLPLFTTRNVESHTTCVPFQDSGSVIDLKFESFGPVPPQNAQRPPQAP